MLLGEKQSLFFDASRESIKTISNHRLIYFFDSLDICDEKGKEKKEIIKRYQHTN